ncbi:hypothetical protein [Priestia sp. YIM B13448]|uniref:hypothetical protein n=1 Tax=Priestia sp. YIM B13448 TaxID=3366308 RepID=UPI00366F8CBC
MSNDIIVEPRSIQIFLEIFNGDFKQIFLGRWDAYYNKILGSDFSSPQEEVILSSYREYEELRKNPPLFADPIAGYENFPDNCIELIRQKSKILTKILAGRFPLSEGEILQSEVVTYLVKPWKRFESGTVVILQVTNLAKVAYILPYLNLDFNTGSVRTPSGVYILTDKIRPQNTINYQLYQQENKRELSGISLDDIGEAILSFTSIAAFVIPSPIGVLLAGALSIVPMFFGGDRNNDILFAEATSLLLKNIQQLQEFEKIKDAADNIETALEWLSDCANILQDLGNDLDAQSYIQDTALPQISDVNKPNSVLRNHLTTLFNLNLPGNKNEWDLKMNALEALTIGVSTYLTYLRLQAQMQAALESDSNYTGNKGLVYPFFDIFRIETLKWTKDLSQRINDLSTQRLNMISELKRGNEHSLCIDATSCSYAGATDGFWYFSDEDTGNQVGKWQDTAISKISCGQVYYESVQHKDEANRERDNYIAALNTKLDERFKPTTNLIRGFKDSIESWSENLNPRTPASSPEINKDLSTWKGSNLQEPWVKGIKVRYAVRFCNSSGQSEIGPWGDEVEITTKSWPLVINIPTDPLNLTSARQIQRQFIKADGTISSETTVAIINDNKTTVYQDITN